MAHRVPRSIWPRDLSCLEMESYRIQIYEEHEISTTCGAGRLLMSGNLNTPPVRAMFW
jgi:hypothetical protein